MRLIFAEREVCCPSELFALLKANKMIVKKSWFGKNKIVQWRRRGGVQGECPGGGEVGEAPSQGVKERTSPTREP